MNNTVILIDGEYARKLFIKSGFRLDVPKLVDKILEETKIEESDLLRVYMYTSAPYQAPRPTPDEKQRYKAFQRFKEFLQRQDNFELKLGRTEKRGDDDFEQKMVDVLLSIDLVELSAKSKINTAILVAGDSDFVPAIKKAKDNGVKTILFCSDNRREFHQNLWKEADKRYQITLDTMRCCCNRQ